MSERQWIDYNEYLRSDVWKQRRAMALERANYRCHVCGETDSLNVHHKTYERLGNESPEDLVVLCRTHHWMEHNPGLPVPESVKPAKKHKKQKRGSKEERCKHMAWLKRKIDSILKTYEGRNMPVKELDKILDLEEKAESHYQRCQVCNPDVLWMYTQEEREAMRREHKRERRRKSEYKKNKRAVKKAKANG